MLYLIDKPLAETGLRIASTDPDPTIVLIQDGVLLDPDLTCPTFAVESDVAVRGVELPEGIEPIAYDELIEQLFEQEVKSFV